MRSNTLLVFVPFPPPAAILNISNWSQQAESAYLRQGRANGAPGSRLHGGLRGARSRPAVKQSDALTKGSNSPETADWRLHRFAAKSRDCQGERLFFFVFFCS